MTNLVPVDDPDDLRVEPYRDIRERDLVGRHGRFVAEGAVVLDVLLGPTSRHAVESLLIAENRVGGLGSLLARVPAGVPVYVARQAVVDRVAGFPLHRGILALGRQAEAPSPADLLRAVPGRAVVLLLLGIANHDNMGGIFRNAAAFGAAAVLLDAGCCDPLYRKAIRVSVGGVLVVPFARLPRAADAVGLVRDAGFEPVALSPGGREVLADLTPALRTAVLLGAEGPGLPTDVLASCRTVRIPIAAGFDSLNVATTAGIVLHHLTTAISR